ncbi:Protein CBG28002 [Caenorhabditis briggsae]|uniref:RNA-directed DNA polymerase n=1 Tax=Caenorhabditis briggsae TaxID=6238 RepID=B6IM63_CAEBR|nr:Protein CBG28002 [Caenorhabditis briggsae]CAS00993.1 Protein CBG28002 [Caenorhabditis briggsae]
MSGPRDTTTGDQAKAMADLTQQLAALITILDNLYKIQHHLLHLHHQMCRLERVSWWNLFRLEFRISRTIRMKTRHLMDGGIDMKISSPRMALLSQKMPKSAINSQVNRIYRTVIINGKKLKMQMDTGADITMISIIDWKLLGSPELQAPTIQVKSANHQPIAVKGFFKCHFKLNGTSASGMAHVAETGTLLGTDWISKDPHFWRMLNANQVSKVSSDVGSACDYLDNMHEGLKAELNKQFSDVFKPELGRCTKTKASLVLKQNAQPVFRKARLVPFAAVSTVSEEIERLQKAGVISPVDHSDWTAPIVLVKKKNGSLRMCADFSTGLNDAIQLHQHPPPTADDIFATLNGGKYFSQIDLAEAYFQIDLDEQAKSILCINTHKGLLRYNRLAFGVKSAPGSLQQVMGSMITGLDGTAAYLDDIIISGSTIEEHNKRLMALMKRINDYGFRIRLGKCTFLMERITFLGFVIDSDGRRPDPEKIAAIDQMPPPTNDSQVRSFLGFIQFYESFVSELFKLRPPLDALTKKDVKFQWTPQCQFSFDRVKQILRSDLLLTHYDPNLPIIVSADASQYGIGAVISHRFPDGSEYAIYHISKALTAPQRNYSQIEKEAFGLITAVTKFHKFIYGRHFTLKTDHKPLLSIFGDKNGIPLYNANRLQRWAIILLNYDFSIEYVNTHDFGQADALSRLISEQIQQTECEDRVIAQVESEVLTNLVTTCDQLLVTAKMIRASSKKDPLLNQVYQYTISGSWPKTSDKTSQLSLFHNRRDQLSIVSECLMFNGRIVIPHALRSRVLKMIHRAHPGIVRMKQLARSLVYWPAIDKDIEKMIRTFLDQLLPNDQLLVSHDTEMEKQFNKQHGARRRSFIADEKVYVKNFSSINTTTWIPGIIQRRIGRTLYRVLVKDTVWIRHINQLRRRDNPIHVDVPLDLMDSIDVTPTPAPALTSSTAPPSPAYL